MKLQERYDNIIYWFRREMPTADTELEFGSVFQLLVAVVLDWQPESWECLMYHRRI